ncbi:MAG: SUMF1/EgtB/PvdO family nonheme iron enzyme [Caldilineaceae bacterium]
MDEFSRRAWGKKLQSFRQRTGYGQGDLSNALSFIRLPTVLTTANATAAGQGEENIDLPNYELSRFERGHRCPRPRSRHLALIYGLVQLGGIQTPAEADEWLALADKRALSVAERKVIFGEMPAATTRLTHAATTLELEFDARRLRHYDATHRNTYLSRIIRQSEYLPLQGVGFADPVEVLAVSQRIGLLDVYIDLETTAKVEVIDHARTRIRPLPALNALVRDARVILLGAPGSGKSTFINYLAYCLASHHLHPTAGWLEQQLPTWPSAWAEALPVPIILRELAAWVQAAQITQRGSRLLLDYLQVWLHQRVLDEFYFVIKERLRTGQALLLLDGLDEIPGDERLRRQIKEMLADLPDAFPQTPILATCRVLSYRMAGWQMDEERWAVYELAELNDPQIQHFIADWYQLLGVTQRVQDVTTLADKLQQAVMRPDLLRLARNPLLLTVMALVHAHKGQLPDARALLYEDVVDLLLWRWEAIKLKNPDGSETTWRQLLEASGLTDKTLKQTLWRLAFQLQRRGEPGRDPEVTADISESELLETLRTLHPTRSLDWATHLVSVIHLRAGLLVEKSPKLFGFPHRTFQEYLAGCHLAADRDFVEVATTLAEDPASWGEAILLAIGYLVHHLASLAQPLLLVGELCPEQTPAPQDEHSWQKIWLAGRAVLEVGPAQLARLQQGRTLLERLRSRLTTLISQDHLEPRPRAEAAVALSVLGDPRNLEEWVSVPGGEFLMGNHALGAGLFLDLGVPALLKRGITQEEAEAFLAAAAPQHRVTVATYHIGKYPVTNGAYARFVAATGQRPPTHWHGVTPAPELHNQPVVYVSWHDALAYCRWLSEQTGQAVRLPTEAEWEKAAVGAQGTLFPWGDRMEPTRLNGYQAGIGATSAVGIFAAGVSPSGALDMAGNVYEWTASLWGDEAWRPRYGYPYDPADGRETLTAPDTVYRVLRGGAYYLNHIFTSCTYRDRDLPTNRGRSLGFRIVVTA